MTTAAASDDANLSRRVTWLCRLLGIGGLALLAVTWKLWTPQDVFPRVPLVAWAPPRWWDWASLAALVAGLIGLCLLVRGRRVSATAVASGFAIQFLADQHRLQPWAWQFFILAVVIALADDRLVFRGWMMLVISIYFWSALSKFDAEFVRNFGAVLTRMLSAPLQFTGWKWSPILQGRSVRIGQCLAFVAPCGELLIAALLCWQRTRRWGFRLSVVLHLYLVLLLGPWGLGHQPGVLLWNLFFLGQNLWLFAGQPLTLLSNVGRAFGASVNSRTYAACTLLGGALLWPAFEPWGYCDAWLGWAVYVQRFEGLNVLVYETTLPPRESELWKHRHSVKPLIATSTRTGRQLLINQNEVGSEAYPGRRYILNPWTMSLAELDVPMYPHPRFTVGVVLDWQQRYGLEQLELIHLRRGDRLELMGKYVRSYTTPAEIEAYARTFRVNALPESVLRRQVEKP